MGRNLTPGQWQDTLMERQFKNTMDLLDWAQRTRTARLTAQGAKLDNRPCGARPVKEAS